MHSVARLLALSFLLANTVAWGLLIRQVLAYITDYAPLRGVAHYFVDGGALFLAIFTSVLISWTLIRRRHDDLGHRSQTPNLGDPEIPEVRVRPAFSHSFHGDPSLSSLCQDPITKQDIDALLNQPALCLSRSHTYSDNN